MRGACALLIGAALLAASAPAPGTDAAIRFDRYDPLSSNLTMAERLLPPLAVRLAWRDLSARHLKLADQPLDLAQEDFRIFVPADRPAAGYGLLVFVPPWGEAAIPPAWKAALARRGIIMVTMARAGNDAPVLGRRDPLAILAATNVMQRYPVDPARVYIGGFSGGSKVAFKLAVGYPDLFTGAFLLAGADPLGEAGFAPPAPELFATFAARSRIVYVTGERDEINVDLARGSAASLRNFCSEASGMLLVPGLNHELIDRDWLGRALDLLDRPRRATGPGQGRCLDALRSRIQSELDSVEALLARGERDAARKKLLAIDARFGGLALPRSLALLDRIDGPPAPPARP